MTEKQDEQAEQDEKKPRKKLSKSDLQMDPAEERAYRAEQAAKVQIKSRHFMPGTHVSVGRKSYAVVAIDGERILITDGQGYSDWIYPIALMGSRRGPSTRDQ